MAVPDITVNECNSCEYLEKIHRGLAVNGASPMHPQTHSSFSQHFFAPQVCVFSL